MRGSSDEPARLVISLIESGGGLRTDRLRIRLLNGSIVGRPYWGKRVLNSGLNSQGGMKADYSTISGEIVTGLQRWNASWSGPLLLSLLGRRRRGH
jgi:hypothetical protein